MSSQDFSPAPEDSAAGGGGSPAYAYAPAPNPPRYWLHALLFVVTFATTTVAGAAMQNDFNRNAPFELERALTSYPWFWLHPAELLSGIPFSLTLLLILLAHEFGHYCAAMYHRVDASLPYFLPSPILGTFGAFIKVRSPVYSKRALFDIGAAGPLAGFICLLPALAVGLAFSKVIPDIRHQGTTQFGSPCLQWLLERAIFPGVASANIYLHPVARAAWVGMFATALNLLPIGQLDGGHIVYAFFPRFHRVISRVMCGLLAVVEAAAWLLRAEWFWPGWLVWAVVLFWLFRRHPAICDESELSPGRRKLGWVSLAVFLLCFTVAPITDGGL